MAWQDMARRQHGVITTAQLRRHGITRHRLATLRSRHDLVSTGVRGVLRSASAPCTVLSAHWVAVLASRGVLSHFSAARLWDMEPASRLMSALDVHVTVPPGRHPVVPAGTRVHRLPPSRLSVCQVNGMPVTDRASTVLDCMRLLPRTEAVTLFDRAVQQGWIDDDPRRPWLNETGRRRGNPILRSVVAEAAVGSARSERLLHAILRRAGIGGWRANVRIGRYEGDVVFEDCKVVIEVDGLAHHIAPDRFQADRRKQNALVTAGWTVLRFTWSDLVGRSEYVADTVDRAVYAARSGAD